MAERLTPGVYVEEISSGIKPIQGVGTATAGFIGEALRGIPDRATFIRGFAEFEANFGGHQRAPHGNLAQAVEAFFAAGGTRAYVVRVLPQNAQTGVAIEPVFAGTDDVWGRDRAILGFQAIGRGEWAEHVRVHIEDSVAFRDRAFTVRVDWVEGGRSRTVEEFRDVVLDPDSPDYVGEVIRDRSRYITVTDLFAAGLDADPAIVLPIPAISPQLRTRDAESFSIPIGGHWTVRMATPELEESQHLSLEVDFDTAAVLAAGGTIADGDATLNPPQLQALLNAQLGPNAERTTEESFRILGPGEPAILTSEPGPWDSTALGAASLEVDGNVINVPLLAAGPAALPAVSGDLPLSPGDEITLAVDGNDPQTYQLVAADVAAAPGGDMTPDEAVTVLNREFGGVQVFLDPAGDLVVRSDTQGEGSRIEVSGALAAALGNPDAAIGGLIQDLTNVTAAEFAASLNAALGDVFSARVAGTRVRIEQVDFNADHTLEWTGDGGYFADNTLQQGRAATGANRVTVEAPIATPAIVVYELDPANAGDLAGAFTLTVSDFDGANDTAVAIAADAGRVTLADFVDAVNTALDDADLDDRVEASIVTDDDDDNPLDALVIQTAEARAGGDRLVLAAAGASPWGTEHASQGGGAGLVVDDITLVNVVAAEVLDPAVPRSLASVFDRTRANGYDTSSPLNPALLPEPTELRPVRLRGGTDGTGPIIPTDFRGSDGIPRRGLRAFDTVDIQLLAIPGRTDDGVIAEGITFVDSRNIFYIADGPGSADRDFELQTNDVVAYVEGLPSRTDNMSMFYPWLEVSDAVGVGRDPRRFVPPSGHLAGVFARTDRLRGVWKAPAGIEATVSGALDLQHQLLDADQDLLNPIGLSCIRDRPGAGIVSWGARTLSSDPEWRYIPVRRTALFIKESLLRGLQWVVFEPNNDELWERIASNITAFMLSLHRQGAFQGPTAEEAFAVKCDRETNPQELVDLGIVNAQVAFAPLKPAEFVVVSISQKSLVAAEAAA